MLLAYNCILFLLLPAVAFYGSRFCWGKKTFAKAYFPREASLYWRGVAALMVIFAHLTIYLEENGIKVGPAVIFDWVGGKGVLLFFFLSGYGTAISTRKTDLKWLIHHILRLWVPVTVLRIIFYFGYNVGSTVNSFKDFILYTVGIVDPAWFIAVMISIYITVFIAKSFFSAHFLTALFVLNLLTSVIFYVCGFSPRWYNGHLVYVFGACLALNSNIAIPKMRKHWGLYLVIYLAVFVIFGFAFAKLKQKIISAPLKIIAGAALGAIVVILSQKIKAHGKTMCLIGSASLYLYIIHYNLYNIMRRDVFALSPYYVVYVSIPVAMVLSFVCIGIERKILTENSSNTNYST